jgi:hypothetical protein
VPIFIEKVDHLGYINTSMKIIYVIFFIMLTIPIWGQQDGLFHIGRVKYAGGGDWYNDPTEEVNLLNYVKAHTNVKG